MILVGFFDKSNTNFFLSGLQFESMNVTCMQELETEIEILLL
jgi:hypothetical protein